MKNSLKRIIALVLSLIILASTAAVSFASFAAPQEDSSITTTTGDEDNEQPHPTFFKLFIEFVKEIYNFFKYIFYDVILGRPAPDVPEPSYYFPHDALAA